MNPENAQSVDRCIPFTIFTIVFLTVLSLGIAVSQNWFYQAFRDFGAELSDISSLALSPLFAWAVGGVLLATFIQTFAVRNRRSALVSDSIACGAGVIALTIYTIGAIVPFASLMQSLR